MEGACVLAALLCDDDSDDDAMGDGRGVGSDGDPRWPGIKRRDIILPSTVRSSQQQKAFVL